MIIQYRNSTSEEDRIRLSLKIQEKLYDLCVFVPAFMTPYVRQGYWRWIQLPKIPGTKRSEGLFEPFIGDYNEGGLFWIDEKIHKETLNAMKKGIKLEPVTIIDKTYMMDIIEGK